MKSDLFGLFDIVHDKWQAVAHDQLVVTLQALQGDFQTCLLEIRTVRGKRNSLLAFLVGGQVINLYRIDDFATRLNENDLISLLPRSKSSLNIRILILTPNTVRLLKILLEQPGSETSVIVKSDQLEGLVSQAMQSAAPILVRTSWPGAQGFALLPGSGLIARQVLFVTSRQVLHSPGNMSALYTWQESPCQVWLYRSQEDTPAWQEYCLHYSFNWLVEYLFQRFEELTGRLLLSAIIRDLNFTTSANGWNISVSATNVTDQAVFSSPQQAGQIYQRLLAVLLNHAVPMLGASLAELILRDALANLPIAYRRLTHNQFQVYVQPDSLNYPMRPVM